VEKSKSQYRPISMLTRETRSIQSDVAQSAPVDHMRASADGTQTTNIDIEEVRRSTATSVTSQAQTDDVSA
jgi:hypothetical protein